jgi:phosphoglycolate phosphatase
MPAPRLLLFDLDGTLIDSSLDLCNSVNAMLVHMGKEPLPNSVIASYIGDGAAMLVRRALGDPGDLDSSACDETMLRAAMDYFLGWYREHKLDNTLPYPGVLDALREIREKQPEMLMAVLTNKPVNPSRAICDALELAPFFFQNYGGNSFQSKKPDPEGFLALVDEANAILAERGCLPLRPEEVVMIGDSDVDIVTGRRCGARTIGCTFGINPAAMMAAAPDALADEASEWVGLVTADSGQ